MCCKVSAIVVAAGSGTRMGFDKIFLKLCNKETILYSLEAFEANKLVDEIILVVSKDNLFRAKELCKNKFNKLKDIVAGGSCRTESVVNGIKASSGDFVAIHDGARPLISQNVITSCIKCVEKYKAVTVCLHVTDTIKHFSENVIESTIDRDSLISVQTPQCFEKNLYLKCLKDCSSSAFTDDCQLFEECKIPVHLVFGEETNIKLTKPSDIIIAEAFIRGNFR